MASTNPVPPSGNGARIEIASAPPIPVQERLLNTLTPRTSNFSLHGVQSLLSSTWNGVLNFLGDMWAKLRGSYAPPLTTQGSVSDVDRIKLTLEQYRQRLITGVRERNVDLLASMLTHDTPKNRSDLFERISNRADYDVQFQVFSIQVEGDRAITKFVRTDRWTEIDTGVPSDNNNAVVTKYLQRVNGNWVLLKQV